jgi:lactoylglutathione lyase
MKLGYTIIYVQDVGKTVDFYAAAFGLSCRFQTPEADYAEMATGETTLSFARDDLAQSHGFSYAPNRADAPAAGIEICLLCEDVPAAYDHAIAKGAVSAAPPKVKPWGQTVAYLRDINGVLVELATPMS